MFQLKAADFSRVSITWLDPVFTGRFEPVDFGCQK